MKKLWGMVTGFLNRYKRYLEYAVLGVVFYAGHYVTVIWYDAQRAKATDRVVEVIPQIIEKTHTITKVIHASDDPCSRTAIPGPILDELRKQ